MSYTATGTDLHAFQQTIREGIPDILPPARPLDPSVSHAPKRKDILNMLGERISQVGRQQQHFDLLDEQILANMASIYSDLISPIGPRIQVAGTPLFLQQPLVQHKVRALLLAGIRAAVLWRQLGGSRTQIIFARKKMVELAKRF